MRRGDWVDYVQGPFFALRERGVALPGLELAIGSDVPRESGLSSSAALGVAVACALREAAGLELGARELAGVAHRGETGFVGVQCGIMDQFASALGQPGAALRIDCRSLEVEAIPVAGGALALLLVHSGVRRQLSSGAYGERVAQCRAALEEARAAGIAARATALRDLGPEDLPALERALAPLPLRRARHVITENARVDAFAAALRGGDRERAGRLLREAMESLRRDFEVSTPELDFLCETGDATARLLRLPPHRRRLRWLHAPPRRPRRRRVRRRAPRQRLRGALRPPAAELGRDAVGWRRNGGGGWGRGREVEPLVGSPASCEALLRSGSTS